LPAQPLQGVVIVVESLVLADRIAIEDFGDVGLQPFGQYGLLLLTKGERVIFTRWLRRILRYFAALLLLIILYRAIHGALRKVKVVNQLAAGIAFLKQPDYPTFYGVVLLFLGHLFLLNRIFYCATFCR
jgi:hypothetical protein